MPTFNVKIGGEIIVLRKASDKTRLKLAVSRFINNLQSSVLLEEDINNILYNELTNTKKINDKIKNNKRI